MFSVNAGTVCEVAGRNAIMYVAVLAGIRLTGKREIGQLTPFDLVILLLLSNAVQNAMTGPDTSVPGGLVAAATLLIVNAVVARFRMRFPRFRRLVEGMPTVLVLHGDVQFGNLTKEQLTVEELQAVLREHEVARFAEVELATLEVDGTVSVIRRPPDDGDRFVKSRKRLRQHHRAP